VDKKERIGLFGGSFDPVHSAHCDIARAAIAQMKLDTLFFIVAPRPPHKQDGPVASPEERYQMVLAAIAGEPRMEASRVELDRPGKSYTVQTLRTFHKMHPESHLYLILGMDSLLDLHAWKEPREIMELAHILAVPRPNLNRKPDPSLAGRYTVLDFPEEAVSSTEIREMIAAGKPWEHLVPKAVRDVITEKGLYHVAV
jgi:nicotinate-nucleotide adenylyltransferase